MPKYLIKQIVEAIQWTNGPCLYCGNEERIFQGIPHKGGFSECSHCGMIFKSYIVEWRDGKKENMSEKTFNERFKKLLDDADTDDCGWC